MTWMCKFSPKWCFVPTHEVCLDPRTRRPSRPTCSSVILPFSPPPSPSSRPYHRVGLILSFIGTRLSDIHTLHRFVTTENKIQSGINPVLWSLNVHTRFRRSWHCRTQGQLMARSQQYCSFVGRLSQVYQVSDKFLCIRRETEHSEISCSSRS